MKAAFIVMSILGCDDSGATCSPVAQVPAQWQTIAACDAASEIHLARYTNVNYPMVVAVCQTADSTALADSTEEAGQVDDRLASSAPQPSPDAEARRGITARAIRIVRQALPTREGLKQTVAYPVHVVTDTYSWMARKISN
ncbi:MAG: hypothetical protein KDJ87_16060 [Rhizobiaceae bacterium]|nr:hypothetical protein [Rhizobiaceae bacterium]